MAFCRDRLAGYKTPRLVEVREELPKTMAGKILRRVLREEESRRRESETPAAPDREERP